MYKLLSIVLIFSTSFLISCSNSRNTISSKQGFLLEYPTSWNAGSDTSHGISFIDPETKGIIVASKNTIVDASKSSNEAIISLYTEQKGILLGSGNMSFGGKPGGYVEFENTYGTNQFYHKDAWGVDGGSLYTLACTVNTTHKDEVKKICDTMIASFKIEK